jgi:hypothetical protein
MMGLALLKENEPIGVVRRDFEEALLQLGDMARINEQKLTLKVDHWIDEFYQVQKREIEQVCLAIQSYKK